ncbi:MAG: substrate-binding domain-containing protein [Bacteroidales bacterium]|nr:substrate-binding domain-containing protein [Bacteroidales bacterium]
MKTLFYSGSSLIYLLGILIILFLSTCEDKSDNGSRTINLDTLTISNYPKVDGSTSAHPLQVLIACKLLGVEYSWMPSWFDETYRIYPSFEEEPEIAQFILDSIIHNGTHGSYVNLINGKADIIIVARTASNDEINLADSLDVILTTMPIALDAFVFIVNINNPVSSLTEKEIQDIYTGNITLWSEVGGILQEINPYQRDPNSGSQELMLSLVMKDLPMLNFPEMILMGMMGPINRITHDKNGLGYTVYFFEQFMAPNDSLKLLAVNGVFPEYNTLKDKEYIYTTEVYMVIRSDLDRSSTAYQLYLWLLTASGRNVIAESGYIPYY